MKKLKIILAFAVLLSAATLLNSLLAQQNVIVCRAVILDGDTIPNITLNEVVVRRYVYMLSPEEIKKNKKLIRNVKITLPYAKTAKRKLDSYEKQMAGMPESQRKAMMKKAEKEIEAEFGADLKKLTFSQGHVLIKLVDRETGNTSYELVRELRGKFRAFFYQTFAKIFGYNLKEKFDPKHNAKDRMIDRIATAVEQGKL
ncbi:MAG: DUF4294 domain-containing protein [Bacteroidales bacterium]|nr:DUF4294 domain-containing protein [Bacteroidales bacterium]